MSRARPISPGEASPSVSASTMANRPGSPRAVWILARSSTSIESTMADPMSAAQGSDDQEGGQLAQQGGPRPVVDPGRSPFGVDQPGLAQRLEVVRNGRSGQGKGG